MKRLALTFVIALCYYSGLAQAEFTLYQLRDNLVQANQINPAFAPVTNVNIGLFSFSTSFNNRFSYADLVVRQEGGGLGLTNTSVEATISQMKSRNRIFSESKLDLFTIGIRRKKMFFTLAPSLRSQTVFSYSDSFWRWAWYGNAQLEGSVLQTEDLVLDDFGFRNLQYLEIPLGLTYKWDYSWTFGARLKYLQGLAAAQTEPITGTLSTDPETGVLGLQAEQLTLHTANLAWAVDGDYQSPGNYSEFRSDTTSTASWGLGLDLGLRFRLNENLSFSGSLLDIGFINWRSNVVNYTVADPSGELPIASINNVLNIGQQSEEPFGLDQLPDSLEAEFTPVKDQESFRTGLSGRFYGSASYRLGAYQRLDASVFGFVAGQVADAAISLGYTAQLGRVFSAAINTTYTQQDLLVGAGFTFNTYAFQLHLMTDNLLAAFQPQRERVAQLRVGLNWAYGRSQDYKVERARHKNRRLELRRNRVEERQQGKAASEGTGG